MGKVLRYLMFFTVGDVLLAVVAASVALLLGHLWFLIDAAYTTAFDLAYEPYGVQAVWALYMAKAEAAPDTASFFLIALILPGLFGAFFMARESLRQPGWRFWQWR